MRVPVAQQSQPLIASRALYLRARQFGFHVKGAQLDMALSIGESAGTAARQVVASPLAGLPCPYCHHPMTAWDSGELARIVGFADARQSTGVVGEYALAEVAPPGTSLLACENCEQAFFVGGDRYAS